MAKAGRKATANKLEGQLLKAWEGKDLKAKATRGLELASLRAVARISELIDSDNQQVALSASKEILARNFGMPKASVDVSVTDTSAAHREALERLHAQALARLEAKAKALPIDRQAEVMEVVADSDSQPPDSEGS